MLLVIFGLLLFGFFVILWLGSVFLQGWIYNDIASKMPIRALIASAIMSGFLTLWCSIYQADPGRFDTLLNFSREKIEGVYNEFESIRKVGNEERKPEKFVRPGGSRGATAEFRTTDGQRPWTRSNADGMVIALLVKEKDQTEPTRFEAQLEKDGKFPVTGLRYVQPKSSRYMDEASLGTIYRVRSMSLMGNLFANFVHLVLWTLVICFVLRFEIGNSIAIGLAIWAITMIAVQPALFSFLVKTPG